MSLRRGGASPARLVIGWGAALFVSACAWFGSNVTVPSVLPVEEDPPTDYERALELLQRQDVIAAELLLRQIASSCESGEDGKRALLFMSFMWLDQHPRARPDSAALLAARFLSLPDTDLLERSLARSIYLVALEMGADPTLRPARIEAPSALAPRFSNCDEPVPPVMVPLPELDREPLAVTVKRLEAERDSLARRVASLEQSAGAQQNRVQELETELKAAQAEIERIRRLLGGRDTTTVRPRRR
jgi:hypothetical protein